MSETLILNDNQAVVVWIIAGLIIIASYFSIAFLRMSFFSLFFISIILSIMGK